MALNSFFISEFWFLIPSRMPEEFVSATGAVFWAARANNSFKASENEVTNMSFNS